jgi:hypothetical protein
MQLKLYGEFDIQVWHARFAADVQRDCLINHLETFLKRLYTKCDGCLEWSDDTLTYSGKEFCDKCWKDMPKLRCGNCDEDHPEDDINTEGLCPKCRNRNAANSAGTPGPSQRH